MTDTQTPPPSDDEPLTQVGWWCWRGDNRGHLATQACRSDNVPIHVPAEWADEMRAVIERIEDGDEDEQPAAVPAVVSVPPPTRAADRAAVLNAAAQHLYTALFPAVYDDMGQKAAEGVNRAVSELRRMADEAQPGPEAERPRCPHCQLPHDLEPGSGAVLACASIRASIADRDAASGPGRVADEETDAETEAHPPSHTWKVESPRRDNWARWGATYDERDWARERYEDAIEHAPGRPFRLVRATTTFTVEAEHTPDPQ